MELRPVYRKYWTDDQGYVDTGERIGYMVLSDRGDTLAYGESESEAWENAFEAEWPLSRHNEEDQASSAVVAR